MMLQQRARSIVGSRLARLLVGTIACAALLSLGCGDASNNTGSTWHNHSNGGPAAGGSTGAADPGTSNPGQPVTGGSTPGTGTGQTPTTDAGTGPTVPPGIDMNIGQTVLIADLLADMQTIINVAPTGGFTGPVNLTFVPGTLPAGAVLTGTFDHPTIDLQGSSSSATLTVRSNATASLPFKVTATAGTVSMSKDLSILSNNSLTINIPADAQMNKGTAGNPRTDAFGPSTGIVVLSGGGLILNIKNLDATAHIIHGPNNGGFVHGNEGAPIPQDGLDEPRTIARGTYGFYLHDQGQVTTGKLIVK